MVLPPDILTSVGSVGVAVSGGSDSVALLFLAIEAIGADRIVAATVDHGLRSASAGEARDVAALCRRLRVDHTTLKWTQRPIGNLQGAARTARYDLLSAWSARNGSFPILLGHTSDDQAETVLLQMMRKAGLSGLSGMRPSFVWNGTTFHRPLLSRKRDELRVILCDAGEPWIDDPSNTDDRYDRVRARDAMKALSSLGIEADALSATAARLRKTETGLRHMLADWARSHTRTVAGDIEIELDALAHLHTDMARRILGGALTFVTGCDYPPRARAIMRALQADRTATLGGCVLYRHGPNLIVGREPARAARAPKVGLGETWDERFSIPHQNVKPVRIGALGAEGLASLPNRSDLVHPRFRLLATPALWTGDELYAVPLLEQSGEFRLTPIRDDFPQWLVSH